eukprot:GHVS01030760.1.p1 GENE.GHVS01030760.1~~GHVS01030760.1.p1  ORF type:complete len:119 (+),score=21.00 GHVS01030760.1:119-475(+)
MKALSSSHGVVWCLLVVAVAMSSVAAFPDQLTDGPVGHLSALDTKRDVLLNALFSIPTPAIPPGFGSAKSQHVGSNSQPFDYPLAIGTIAASRLQRKIDKLFLPKVKTTTTSTSTTTS